MNKKKGGWWRWWWWGAGGVTTANESCWWRRAWRWGTWKRLVNASETSRSQTGYVACFYSAQENWNLHCHYAVRPALCIFLNFWLLLLCIYLFPSTVHLTQNTTTLINVSVCRMWYSTEWCGGRPPRQHVAGHAQAVQGNPGLVTGSGQGCEARPPVWS